MKFQEELNNTIQNEISTTKKREYLISLIQSSNISVIGNIDANSRYSQTIFNRNDEKAEINNSVLESIVSSDFRSLIEKKLKQQEAIITIKKVFEAHKLPVAIVQRKDTVEIQVPGDMMIAKHLIETLGVSRGDFKMVNSVITINNEAVNSIQN